MKKASVVLLALVCIGCAASATHTYRPAAPAAEWQIEGTQSTFGKVLISINGTPVIQGSMSVWSGDGRFSGTYQNLPVAAVCDKGSGYVRTRCVLTINSEKIATLYFRAL
jgi:hypothetical protein